MTETPTLLDNVSQTFRDHGLTAAITALMGGSLWAWRYQVLLRIRLPLPTAGFGTIPPPGSCARGLVA